MPVEEDEIDASVSVSVILNKRSEKGAFIPTLQADAPDQRRRGFHSRGKLLDPSQ